VTNPKTIVLRSTVIASDWASVWIADNGGLSGGFVFDRADDRRENGSAGPACDQLRNDATKAQIA
jgi:hypothetical protein